MHYFRYVILTVVFSCLLWLPAKAQRVPHKVSLTISPIHLVMPVIELTGEFKVEDDVSVAAIAGIGAYEGFSVLELGGQFNYYLIGNFQHGMQLGAGILYLSLSDEYKNRDVDISAVGRGLAIGPYLGYKIAAGFGLTFTRRQVYLSLC